MTEKTPFLFAYIDPSAGALVIQLLISATVGSYVFLKRSAHWLGSILNRTTGFQGLLIAFSFANLSLLRIWTELFGFSTADTFEMKQLPPAAHYSAAVVDLLLLTLLIWPVIQLSSRASIAGKAASVTLVILSVIPLNAVRDVMGSERFPMLRFTLVRVVGPRGVYVMSAAVIVTGIVLLVFFLRQLRQVLCFFLLVTSPFSVLTAVRATWLGTHTEPSLDIAGRASAVRSSNRAPRSHVVWILLDEMDQRITFEDRPTGLQMPEFDRLRSSSFYASDAAEAGPDTIPAVPSMLTGRTISKVRELGPFSIGITFEGTSTLVDLSTTDNLFKRTRELGYRSGAVGWAIPYCKIFGPQLNRCWWCEAVRPDNSIRDTLPLAALDEARSLFETQNFSLFGQSICLRQHTSNYFDALREATDLATDRNIDFALVHLQGAHPPHVYNRAKGDFSLANSPIRGYTDTLALCDRTLGTLRRSMEAAGTWDASTVLVTSDHHSRSSRVFDGKTDHRVIFLMKMPLQREGSTYNAPFTALVMSDLIIDVLNGRISNPQDVAHWLDTRSAGLRQSSIPVSAYSKPQQE